MQLNDLMVSHIYFLCFAHNFLPPSKEQTTENLAYLKAFIKYVENHTCLHVWPLLYLSAMKLGARRKSKQKAGMYTDCQDHETASYSKTKKISWL